MVQGCRKLEMVKQQHERWKLEMLKHQLKHELEMFMARWELEVRNYPRLGFWNAVTLQSLRDRTKRYNQST